MSMRDAGILDGDMLAVHHTSNVRSGQIVVARLNGEVTVKRLKRQGRAIELVPENPALKPIKVDDSDDLAIEGIAVGLVRSGRVL
jgi:repressor LexA